MMIIQNEGIGAVRRGFFFLVLALCLGSVVAGAAPQKYEDKSGTVTACVITSINTARGVVSAKDNTTGQSFRFFVKDSALLNSLKEGQQIVADFNTQQVFTKAGANGQGLRLGGILGAGYGNTPLGPVDGSRPAGPVDGAKPLGPVDGVKPVGPVDGVRPVGPIDGARPAGPIDGARPLQPVDGAHLGNAANPGEPCCQITSINPVTGIVSAKLLSSGQAFQFTVKDSALFRSFSVGQRFFANFNSHEVSFDGKAFTGVQSFSFANASSHK